jgi:hypothetical protein
MEVVVFCHRPHAWILRMSPTVYVSPAIVNEPTKLVFTVPGLSNLVSDVPLEVVPVTRAKRLSAMALHLSKLAN